MTELTSRRLEIDALRALWALRHHGGITRAAEALGLSMVPDEPIPFLSFDDDCFYRRWALDIGQDGGVVLETVFECASSAGIVAAVSAGLGVALLNGRHLQSDMEIISHGLPAPPALAYVVRRGRKVRNPALDTLVSEIESEISRYGGLALAG